LLLTATRILACPRLFFAYSGEVGT
jgi:hypothetical protein